MQKIVINCCWGGFGLSAKAQRRYFELENQEPGEFDAKYETYANWQPWDIHRDDYNLVRVVEELGEHSWGYASELKVVHIPDGVNWYIRDNDGQETVCEVHREWC